MRPGPALYRFFECFRYIYCHSCVPQGSHLDPLFFISHINDVLDIFDNVRALAYADELKLYMRFSSTDDCRLFQQDLNRLQGWCFENKYDLNAGKCKSISFSRGSKPVMFQYVIGDSDLERFGVIIDLGVLVDSRITFFNHIELIVSKSAIMLGFIKRISGEFSDLFTYKTLYVAYVRPD
jgi:hypothetical protein